MSFGIDISYAQDVHNYDALASQVEYVLLKASGSNTGSNYVDSKYHRHANAIGGRKPTGSYYMNGASDATSAARFFVSNLNSNADDFAVLDIETIDGYACWSPAKSLEWVGEVRRLGYTGPIFAYMNTSVAQSADWSALERAGVGLWLANYGQDNGSLTSPNPDTGSWSTWQVHQYTQEGRLAGYAGPLDLNRAKAGVFDSGPSASSSATFWSAKRWIISGLAG